MRTWITSVIVSLAVVASAFCAAALAQEKLNEADQAFFTTAALGNMAEVQLGTLATQKATADPVKQFAQRMVTDHGKAQQELMNLARENSWTAPSELTDEQKKVAEQLGQQSGEAFDKAYMTHMVGAHAADAKLYEGAAQTCQNAALKGYAARTLPIIQEHLKQAREISGIKEEEAKPEK
jgi:putative membrane protein